MARESTRNSLRTNLEHSWLQAEARGDEDAAETALASLLSSLPEVAPRSGFAARVLRRAGVAAERRDLFARRGVQWAIASSLVLAAVVLLFAPGVLRAVFAPFAGSWSLTGAVGDASQLFILAG